MLNNLAPITRTHTIKLPFPAEKAFHFFTPKGEEIWIKEWRPDYIWPKNGETQKGMVFATGDDAAKTYWCMVDFDQENFYSRYSRLTPNSRSVLVEVKIEIADTNHCQATITYNYIALNDNDVNEIQDLTEEKFREMINDWQKLIIEYC